MACATAAADALPALAIAKAARTGGQASAAARTRRNQACSAANRLKRHQLPMPGNQDALDKEEAQSMPHCLQGYPPAQMAGRAPVKSPPVSSARRWQAAPPARAPRSSGRARRPRPKARRGCECAKGAARAAHQAQMLPRASKPRPQPAPERASQRSARISKTHHFSPTRSWPFCAVRRELLEIGDEIVDLRIVLHPDEGHFGSGRHPARILDVGAKEVFAPDNIRQTLIGGRIGVTGPRALLPPIKEAVERRATPIRAVGPT